MISDDTILAWLGKIGNYELSKDSPRQQCDAGFNVDLFLPPGAKAKLYQSTHPADTPEPRVAREKFFLFLVHKFRDVKSNPDNRKKTTSLADFLADDIEDGVALYHAAVEEEAKTKAFRDAVFFRSLKHFPGPKWAKRLILWVGGPSSSGKTYGAQGVLEKISRDILKKSTEQKENNIISVDGSFERETSQMRQMVLQFALASGYKGIQDLHKHSKALSVKEHIREAALETKDLSLVIPDTFVRNPSSVQQEFNEYEKMDVVQAFSEVKAEKNFEARFQNSVKKMGDARAWKNEEFTVDKISINNRTIGCESKVYQGRYFKLGLHGTKIFKKFYKAFSRDKLTLTINNDLVYLVKKDGTWVECRYDDDLSGKVDGVDFLRMTARAYNYWQENHSDQPLEIWCKKMGGLPKFLTGQVITHKDNKKYQNGFSFFNFVRVDKLWNSFTRKLQHEQQHLVHQIAVNTETIAELEKKVETLADKDAAKLLNQHLEKCKLLQTSLKEKVEKVAVAQAEAEAQKPSSPQFLPYLDSYIDIPVADKELLLEQSIEGEKLPTAVASEDANHGEYLAPGLQPDCCRVHYVELTSTTSPKQMFVQERLPESLAGLKISSVDQSINRDPVALLEYSLAMASSMLLGLSAPPTVKNPLILTGSDSVLTCYLWTALLILGEKTPGMKFTPESIMVVTAAFSPIKEMTSGRKFVPTSLHETIFRTHDDFVAIKARELATLIKLKNSPVEQANLLSHELMETTKKLSG